LRYLNHVNIENIFYNISIIINMKVYVEHNLLQGSDITEIFKDVYSLVDARDCDYFLCTSIDGKILSYKHELQQFYKKAKQYNKQILFFGQGDTEHGYISENAGFCFKNDLYKSTKHNNEFALTSLSNDRVPNITLTPCETLSVGFCGASDRFNRNDYLLKLYQSKLKTDFIIKNGPQWGTTSITDCSEINKLRDIQLIATNEFYDNITRNMFTLCIRGWGNYSYRFSQVICSGRIPILIDTDCVLPFEDIFDYNNTIVRVLPTDNIVEKVETFYKTNKNNIFEIQKCLYSFGMNYLTPIGFFKHIDKLLK